MVIAMNTRNFDHYFIYVDYLPHIHFCYYVRVQWNEIVLFTRHFILNIKIILKSNQDLLFCVHVHMKRDGLYTSDPQSIIIRFNRYPSVNTIYQISVFIQSFDNVETRQIEDFRFHNYRHYIVEFGAIILNRSVVLAGYWK